mmetsp:Transcript_8828/g.18880  ORF Transcript_8828/g.18880 Transcript_8828/m.18880 type:complete len:102 (-) Transcript_8828:27-332(-)
MRLHVPVTHASTHLPLECLRIHHDPCARPRDEYEGKELKSARFCMHAQRPLHTASAMRATTSFRINCLTPRGCFITTTMQIRALQNRHTRQPFYTIILQPP